MYCEENRFNILKPRGLTECGENTEVFALEARNCLDLPAGPAKFSPRHRFIYEGVTLSIARQPDGLSLIE